jgi:redox-sensing transcriptional repressor
MPPRNPEKRTPNRKAAAKAGNAPIDARRIPAAVIKRLSLYARVLQNLERQCSEKVSSTELARLLGFTPAQVRKDLAHFGQFGVPGFGYPVAELRKSLRHILGTDREIQVALVGVGHLGTALLSYGGFARQGFRIVCAFDKEVPATPIGTSQIPVHPVEELESRLAEHAINFAILTVSGDAAQSITNRLVAAGVTAILNFVPVRLQTPEHVMVHYVDLALEMESLSFYTR